MSSSLDRVETGRVESVLVRIEISEERMGVGRRCQYIGIGCGMLEKQ